MPAAESTWRNQDRLNVIFGVSGLVLLVATLLMFYRDHDRPWKRIQPQAVSLDNKLTLWREEQFKTDVALREHTELMEKLFAAQSANIDPELIQSFEAAAGGEQKSVQSAVKSLVQMNEQLSTEKAKENNDTAIKSKQLQVADARRAVVKELKRLVDVAKVQEDKTLGERKFANAYVDAAKARYDLGIRDNAPDLSARMAKVQEEVSKVAALTEKYQVESTRRREMERVLKVITAPTDAAQKAVDDNQAGLRRLEATYADKDETYFKTAFGIIPVPGKQFLNLAILDAFGTRRRIDNLWADGLEQDYNFRKVRRFDRCTTCHQLMQKSLPGQPTTPAYVLEREFDVILTASPSSSAETSPMKELENVVGIRLADEGLLSSQDVAIKYVRPESPAAKTSLVNSKSVSEKTAADLRRDISDFNGSEGESKPIPGLLAGDVVAAVTGQRVFGASTVGSLILNELQAKKSVRLTIRRGLPQPFATHPNLDLFVGDSSPHPMGKFACTICHEGQGSATEFKWASHAPNTPAQAEQWRKDHGWFDNGHWIYPMNPARFAESSCLKCHHNVVELEASEKFPKGPANQLIHGYHLITKYGCYGCHEVNGYDGPNRRIGPDLRLEPSFFAVSQQIRHEIRGSVKAMNDALSAVKQGSSDYDAAKQKFAVVEKVVELTNRLTDRPDDNSVRATLKQILEEDALKVASGGANFEPSAHRLSGLLKDVEASGSLRKPGPSLRFAKSKLDNQFFYDWVENPKNFRASTRMPRFFGLWDHLEDHGKMADEVAPKMEPVEIHALVSYLNSQSQNFVPVAKPAGVDKWSTEEKVARGKTQFEIRGCLACHTHKDFPDTAKYKKGDEIVQGPDLSEIAAKFAKDRNPQGPEWLYSWIKEPTRYHARTVMPNLFLDSEKDSAGKVFDPADDVTAYLLSVSSEWKLSDAAKTKVNSEALLQFTLDNLKEAVFEKAAKTHSLYGIPADMASGFKGVEQELVVPRADFDAKKELSDEQRLRYIGRKSVAKYGCYGCHDIPGFEDAKPIGTGLADWGRKDPSKLAFEHITHYIEHGHGVAGHKNDHGHAAESPVNDSHSGFSEQDEKFYLESLESGHRAGFIYQKLKEPRSYDFKKTENKRYNERLRMPEFPFTATEREAVITFVLGLVADPPNPKYVYKPDPRQAAIQQGRIVLEKYNCGGCHILEAERWQLSYTKDAFRPQSHDEEYPFLRPNVSSKALELAAKPDFRGQLHSRIDVLPALPKANTQPVIVDDEGSTLEDSDPAKGARVLMDLWKPAVLSGSPFVMGIKSLSVDPEIIDERYPTRGGNLTRYLLPRVIKLEKQSNANANGTEAWGWLPPPLIGEGEKVQTAWLHDFLLNPYPIRPAVFLRMPKFNMSSEEAGQIVAYFAAMDGASYPYEYSNRRDLNQLQVKEEEYQKRIKSAETKPKSDSRFGGAMNIVVDANYCVKCHLVGDFAPAGSIRAKGPNLADVYRRLRPEYVRNWIAKPTKYLPYTPMPVNIPFKPGEANLGGVKQELFHGTSIEQLDGLVDLLMNFDQFAQQNVSVTKMVPPPPKTGDNPSGDKPATDSQQN